jgi:chromate transport protein ChrA
MARQNHQPRSLYVQMRHAVEAGYGRRRWLALMSGAIVALVAVSSGYQVLQGSPWPATVLAALLVVAGLIITGAMAGLLFENLQHTDHEDQGIELGVAFLQHHVPDEKRLGLIERRATRGSEAVQLRTTLPALLLTLAAAGLFTLVVPPGQSLLAVGLLIVVLALLREVGRANTDQIILNAIDQWRVESDARPALAAASGSAQPASQHAAAPARPRVVAGRCRGSGRR